MAARGSRATGYDLLAADIKTGQLHPAYLLWGSESFLITRSVTQLIELALDGATDDPFNVNRFTAGVNPLGDALAVAAQLPMFKSRRVVVVDGVTAPDAYGYPKLALKKPERDQLAAYMRSPNPSTVLILTGSVADRKQRFLNDLSPPMRIYDLSAPPADRLLRWIPGKAAASGFKIEPEAAAELLSVVGPSMQRLSSEIEKMAVYCEEGATAGCEDVRALAEGATDDNVFEMSDALGRRDAVTALKILRRVVELHVDGEIRVLAEMRRRLTLWLQIRTLLDRGETPATLGKAIGLPVFVVRMNTAAASGFGRVELVHALRRVLGIERDLKQGVEGTRTRLELLVLDLVGSRGAR